MSAATGIPGFKGLKADVLVALKKSQPLTAGELGERFGVTANALRRHLKELEQEGLVAYQREIRGVGQPTFVYRLTSAGERLFPNSYDDALQQALALVRTQIGAEAVVEIFRQRWADIAERAKHEIAHLPLPDRAQALARILTSLGYMAEATPGDQATLRHHNCTIRAVVDQFPEVCAAEERFIQDVLGAQVTRQAHIAKGANCCEYCIAEPATLRHRPATVLQEPPAGPTPRLQETA